MTVVVTQQSPRPGRNPQAGLGCCARSDTSNAQHRLLHVPEDWYLP